MKKILVLGAGRSSAYLFKYFALNAAHFQWKVIIGDYELTVAQEKAKIIPEAEGIRVDVNAIDDDFTLFENADLVISLLPPQFHVNIARLCLKGRCHLITASYVSEEMLSLHEEASSKGLIFLNEMGLDPGIDHLSAMKIIHEIRDKGGEIVSFKSYAGGLVAPESDNNPWHYKFTWNPKNVVMAGQGVTQFMEKGQYKFLPYHQLFKRITKLEHADLGTFEAYANRDSLKYKSHYGLENVPTLLRGTIRKVGYCEAWNVFVQLGMTESSFEMDTQGLTYRDFLNAFLPYSRKKVEDKLLDYLQDEINQEIFDKIKWLGLFEREIIDIEEHQASPAQILQHVLEKKWALSPNDHDMIVMMHRVIYQYENKTYQLDSDMSVIGEDHQYTAMAKTVGLPLGIAARLILEGKLNLKGVLIPVHPEIYEPALKELRTFDIVFKENRAVL